MIVGTQQFSCRRRKPGFARIRRSSPLEADHLLGAHAFFVASV